MSGMWGNKIKISIFGESHGNAIGINIDGLEPGFEINLDKVSSEMKRRAPGRNNLSTPRKDKLNRSGFIPAAFAFCQAVCTEIKHA